MLETAVVVRSRGGACGGLWTDMELGVLLVVVLYTVAAVAGEVDNRARTNRRGKGSMWW